MSWSCKLKQQHRPNHFLISITLSALVGNSLITLTFHLLDQYGLVELFRLDVVRLWRFLVLVQEDYHAHNPYHNAVHAADVTQAMYCYLREPAVRHLAHDDIFFLPLCSAIHCGTVANFN